MHLQRDVWHLDSVAADGRADGRLRLRRPRRPRQRDGGRAVDHSGTSRTSPLPRTPTSTSTLFTRSPPSSCSTTPPTSSTPPSSSTCARASSPTDRPQRRPHPAAGLAPVLPLLYSARLLVSAEAHGSAPPPKPTARRRRRRPRRPAPQQGLRDVRLGHHAVAHRGVLALLVGWGSTTPSTCRRPRAVHLARPAAFMSYFIGYVVGY